MPDITMCLGYTCRKRKTCYRFTATPTSYTDKDGNKQTYQTYFSADPRVLGKCEHYAEIWRKK